MQEYIHYGHKSFNLEDFDPIKNQCFVKPLGGLWASPVDAQYGWKNWCESNDFRECNENNSFKFTLSENANVLHLYKVSDLKDLPINTHGDPWLNEMARRNNYLDFEKIKSMGYDAIELHLSEEEMEGDWEDFTRGLYWQLYGWDCDSILIMNPEIIIQK